jgi:hypothetical protein
MVGNFFFERTQHFIDQIKSLQSISRIQSGATENLAKPESLVGNYGFGAQFSSLPKHIYVV